MRHTTLLGIALCAILGACYVEKRDTSSAETGSGLPSDTVTDPDTETSGDTDTDGRYHPLDYADADVHGLPAKLQEERCVNCHGEDLAGGFSGVSCDDCHQAGWRTTCTYCHGGEDTPDGAPPRDIDNNTDAATITFPSHTSHVTTDLHTGEDCSQCHNKPTDVLTPGHIFLDDDTPAVSEVTFAGGLSSAGTYDGGGSCSNLYCHGDGRSNEDVTSATGSSDCDACHGDATSAGRLGGEHDEHSGSRGQCGDCHLDTVANNDAIINPAKHVNGVVDVAMTGGMTYVGGRCAGSCHGEGHRDESW